MEYSMVSMECSIVSMECSKNSMECSTGSEGSKNRGTPWNWRNSNRTWGAFRPSRRKNGPNSGVSEYRAWIFRGDRCRQNCRQNNHNRGDSKALRWFDRTRKREYFWNRGARGALRKKVRRVGSKNRIGRSGRFVAGEREIRGEEEEEGLELKLAVVWVLKLAVAWVLKREEGEGEMERMRMEARFQSSNLHNRRCNPRFEVVYHHISPPLRIYHKCRVFSDRSKPKTERCAKHIHHRLH